MRAGLLPLFALDEISVLSGISALWQTDRLLALVVALFALAAPIAKTAGVALVQFGILGRRALGPLGLLGKFAMADVFLVALYVVLAKGIGVGRLETAWGLYLFTACILVSVIVTAVETRRTS